MRCVIQTEGLPVRVGHNQAESNLEGYKEKMRIFEGNEVFGWASAREVGDLIQMDQITARSNLTEFGYKGPGGIFATLAKVQVSMSEPELESKAGAEWD